MPLIASQAILRKSSRTFIPLTIKPPEFPKYYIYHEHKVTVTVYNAVPGQTDDSPDVTASGFNLNLNNPEQHRIVAVSRDLLKKFPYGDTVYVKGTSYDGLYIVQDIMNARYRNTIDLLINIDSPIGKWKGTISKTLKY